VKPRRLAILLAAKARFSLKAPSHEGGTFFNYFLDDILLFLFFLFDPFYLVAGVWLFALCLAFRHYKLLTFLSFGLVWLFALCEAAWSAGLPSSPTSCPLAQPAAR
jgi:hypothetical protein